MRASPAANTAKSGLASRRGASARRLLHVSSITSRHLLRTSQWIPLDGAMCLCTYSRRLHPTPCPLLMAYPRADRDPAGGDTTCCRKYASRDQSMAPDVSATCGLTPASWAHHHASLSSKMTSSPNAKPPARIRPGFPPALNPSARALVLPSRLGRALVLPPHPTSPSPSRHPTLAAFQ